MKINMLKVIRTITAVLEKTSPSLANKLAIKLFFSPRASKQRLPELPELQQHWCDYVKTDGNYQQLSGLHRWNRTDSTIGTRLGRFGMEYVSHR